ncbi:FAD-dependent monooxygenase [Streptomyces sp. NPDC018584]|uniref:FAD-dependent monooxygenase n=1 Tax=unclassified Streptomyces TaxID=2593676 RepID=UPI0037BB3058
MTALDLARAGVDVMVVDKRRSRTGRPRALNLYPRTLEILHRRGLAEPCLAQGRPVRHAHFAALPVMLSAYSSMCRAAYG